MLHRANIDELRDYVKGDHSDSEIASMCRILVPELCDLLDSSIDRLNKLGDYDSFGDAVYHTNAWLREKGL